MHTQDRNNGLETCLVQASALGIVFISLALGFGLTEFMRYVHVDPLLAFLVAGFVVQNLSTQGAALTQAVGRLSGLVFVVFFGTAGADLDLELLLALWPVALALSAVRGIATVAINEILGPVLFKLGLERSGEVPEPEQVG